MCDITIVLAVTALVWGAMASMSVVYAQSPTPSKSTTASAAVQTATPALATPVASTSVFAPSTPPPPTPTPRLPEEGGPPGGVLGGHLYVDNDGSRSFAPGDSVWGGLVLADLLDSDGRSVALFGSAGDASGTWQIRALADGVYRLTFDPQIPSEQMSLTIPPATLDPVTNRALMVRTVEIRNANRILDIDFGVPPQSPAISAQAPRLPSTGKGGGSWGNPNNVLLLVGLGASAVLAGGLAVS